MQHLTEEHGAGRFVVRTAHGTAEWDALFAEVERPHLTQSWAYGEAKKAAGGQKRLSRGLSVRRLVIERAGVPVAVCQVLDKTVAGIRVASRLQRGPLLLGTDPGADVAEGVYRALRHAWRHLVHGALLLAPALEAGDQTERLLSASGFRPRGVKGWLSSVLDLRRDEERLRADLAPTWRNRLNKSDRAGLTFRADETAEALDWTLARHVENMADKQFEGPSASFVRALCEASRGDWFVARAFLPGEDAPVASMLVCGFGNTAEYYVGWFGPQGRKANASNFLYWNAAMEAKRRGRRRFDLGGYDRNEDSGLRHFKQGMRGSDYELADERLAF